MQQVSLGQPTFLKSATESVQSVLSFQPFYRYLQQKVKGEKTVKSGLYQTLIDKIDGYPELKDPISPDQLSQYSDLFELIYAYLTGITTEETETLWGLAPPKPGPIFYGTDSLCTLFCELLVDVPDHLEPSVKQKLQAEMNQRENYFIYSLILERCYDFNPIFNHEMVHSLIDWETNLSRYYRVHVDTRFVDLSYKGKLPALDFQKIEEHVHSHTLFEYLREALPLNRFTLTGFNVVYFTEFTEQHTIQSLKNMLLDSHTKPKEEKMAELIQNLRTLAGCRKLDFGFIPIVHFNGQLMLDFGTFSSSVLLNYDKIHHDVDSSVRHILEEIIQNPRTVFWDKELDLQNYPGSLPAILQQAELHGFALLPLYHNNQLTGVLEVYSREAGVLSKKMLIKLDPALPHIAQMLKIAVDDFNGKITRTINDKFTSIQPAVQWRFNKAAWNYLYNSFTQKREPELEKIVFEQLFPLYGAVDIRNSSIERNQAVVDDLHFQLTLLAETLENLKLHYPLGLLDKMAHECRIWLQRIHESFTTEESIQLAYFLDQEAMPALKHFQQLHPDSAALVENYCRALDEATGQVHENRRNLELSIQMITRALDAYLDTTELELQNAYPFYFEKYRTDGVEYDMFIGQSLAPGKPFDRIYLKNLRLWQVQSMAHIGNLVHRLQPDMPKKLDVTLLIYVNSDPIDIHFRNDEKRFDVEGGYNVRYQMIKKRIDKVRIRETNERLTQPEKIALVYTNKNDADEYISHIRYLQQQGLLLDDLEELELEELQGVSGLKALRVGVRIG